MKKNTLLIIVMLITTLLIGACSSTTLAEEVNTAVDLVDGYGREITLDLPVERIVSIAPSNVEILFALGAGDLIVGRDDMTDFPEEALEIESIGSTWGELNTEAIVALEPDVVLGAELTSPEQIAQLEALDIPVFVIGNPADFDGLYANLRLAGTITGQEAEAETVVSHLQERQAAVEQKVAGAETVSVFYEVDGTDPAAPWTAGVGTFHDYVISMAAGENIAAEVDYYNTLSSEEIIAANPEVIVFASGAWVTTTVESIAERPGWDGIDAVVNGRVYGIDTNWFDRPGPRLMDAYEAMAAYLHPELFE
ncbi:MAG: ABC transporter substrate-binding protein [Anaerolineales bacterium]|nr:ABC transporter substrate-binding protein [Anaerolineales bacterium]